MALTDNLISHWTLDEASGDRADSHGSNTLTDNNTVGSAAGKIGNAGDFEAGDSEFLSRADNASLSTGDIDFTIAAWVNFESITGTRTIVSKGTFVSEATFEYWLRYSGTSGEFTLSVGNNVSSALIVGGVPLTATWYFVVAWHDASADTVNIQVNNGTVASAAWTDGAFDSAGSFCIGSASAGGNEPMDGLIDSVSFWKRVLTTAERTQLYNGGNGLAYENFVPRYSVAALYPFFFR